MLGTCNVKYTSGESAYTESHSVTMKILAGEKLGKGDIVDIVSEGLPMDLTSFQTIGGSYMPYIGDGSGDNYTWSKPKNLPKAAKTHCFHLNTNTVQTGYLGLYHVCWDDTKWLTWGNGISGENVGISAISSACWGEPIEFEENWWLIPSQGSNSSSVTDSTGTSVGSNPSCVYLVYVNPETAKATRKYFLAIPCGYNSCNHGKPFIARMSNDEFIFVHHAALNGIYSIDAYPFKIDLSDPENPTMNWVTRLAKTAYYSTSDFYFFGASCNFVDKENGALYFLGETQYKYWQIKYNKTRTAFETPQTKTYTPVDTLVKQWRPDLTYGNFPIIQRYYNDLSVGCNIIRCSDGKHLINVTSPYNYHDFEYIPPDATKNETMGTIKDTLVPLLPPINNCRVLSQDFGTGGNYYIQDWAIAQNYNRGIYNLNSQDGAHSNPWLCKVSDTKYVMAYKTILTNAIESTTQGQTWLGTPMVMLDYCDKLHRLDWNAHYIYNGHVYNTSYPEAAYHRPFVFLDAHNRIQRLVSRYVGSYNYYHTGQNYHNVSELPKKSLNLTAYKIGTKVMDENCEHYAVGRVQHPIQEDEVGDVTVYISKKY